MANLKGSELRGLPNVLLYDDNFMVRRTFEMLAKETITAKVLEIANPEDILKKCMYTEFDMMIIGIDEWFHQLKTIEWIRHGKTKNREDIPIIVMVSNITNEKLGQLKVLNINEVLIKPTRIKNIQDVFLRNIMDN
jgi:DNA-binding NtrC family response regulator